MAQLRSLVIIIIIFIIIFIIIIPNPGFLAQLRFLSPYHHGCYITIFIIITIIIDLTQRQKNLGSRVALLPGKFLGVQKVFTRITEQTL